MTICKYRSRCQAFSIIENDCRSNYQAENSCSRYRTLSYQEKQEEIQSKKLQVIINRDVKLQIEYGDLGLNLDRRLT